MPVALAAAVFAYAATHRIVDDDEGYYALAGRAMLAGELPYRDFFLPQMPLGPLAYGVVSAIFGPGLLPLRWFAAACTLGTVLVVQRAARRAAGPWAGAVAVVLVVAHTLVWEWAPTIKTFPLALLLGTGALALSARTGVTTRSLLFAGVCAGLAVAVRALSLPVAVAVVLSPLFTTGDPSRRGRLVGAAAAGVGLALVPAFVVAAFDPAAFWFDNVGYHAIRGAGAGLVKDLPQKLDVARAVFLSPLGAKRPDVTGMQTTTLFVAVGLSVVGLRRRRDAEAIAVAGPFALAVVLLALTSFLPSPSWSQYFAACVPPASVVVASCWPRQARTRLLAALLLVAYGAVVVPSFVDRLAHQLAYLRPAAFDAVARALDGLTAPGVPVAAHDPAYLVASARAPLREAMNPFAREYSSRISERERRRFHLFTEPDFRDAILAAGATFVVGRGVVMETALPLKSAGFRRAAELPGATIWVRAER